MAKCAPGCKCKVIPLSNERLHCGIVLKLLHKITWPVIPLSNERLHCGQLLSCRCGGQLG